MSPSSPQETPSPTTTTCRPWWRRWRPRTGARTSTTATWREAGAGRSTRPRRSPWTRSGAGSGTWWCCRSTAPGPPTQRMTSAFRRYRDSLGVFKSLRSSILRYCAKVPPLDALVAAILTNNPATKIQFYLSWGRPGGEPNLCRTMPQFCSYEAYQVDVILTL